MLKFWGILVSRWVFISVKMISGPRTWLKSNINSTTIVSRWLAGILQASSFLHVLFSTASEAHFALGFRTELNESTIRYINPRGKKR
jgi:hypothetical protein